MCTWTGIEIEEQLNHLLSLVSHPEKLDEPTLTYVLKLVVLDVYSAW